MTGAGLAVGLSLIASIWFQLAYCWRSPSLGKSVVKTVSVGGLAIAAIWLNAPVLLIAALLLGALGDFCLSRDGDPAFLTGLTAFAFSHLAYVALFVSIGAGLTFGLLSIYIGVFAIGMGAVLFQHAGALRWPVAAYVCIIGAMGLLAADLPLALALAGFAALLFIISDTVLGLEMFVLSSDGRLKRYAPFVVWPTYWLAQFLFLLSFAGPVFA